MVKSIKKGVSFRRCKSCLFRIFSTATYRKNLFCPTRWKESTLNNPFQVAKATWPVPYIEALFLPDFKVKGPITESNFQVYCVILVVEVELMRERFHLLLVFNALIYFQILCHISHGAFGQVYHVRKVDTGDDYAMKILSKAKVIIILTVT